MAHKSRCFVVRGSICGLAHAHTKSSQSIRIAVARNVNKRDLLLNDAVDSLAHSCREKLHKIQALLPLPVAEPLRRQAIDDIVERNMLTRDVARSLVSTRRTDSPREFVEHEVGGALVTEHVKRRPVEKHERVCVVRVGLVQNCQAHLHASAHSQLQVSKHHRHTTTRTRNRTQLEASQCVPVRRVAGLLVSGPGRQQRRRHRTAPIRTCPQRRRLAGGRLGQRRLRRTASCGC
jgi:hypothetical protein